MPQSVRYIFKNFTLFKARLIKQRWMSNANVNICLHVGLSM